MDAIGGDYTRPKSKPVATQDENSVEDGEDEREALLPLKKHESEEALLPPPPRRGGMSRKSEKTRKVPRKVQWNDRNGRKLTEVLEFQPSDASDSDDEESDSCVCSIM